MATLLPAALAWAEREGGVTGRAFLTALAVGVDIAIGLGLAARAGLRFFRPATAGGFGATAAVARLAGLDEAARAGAFGLQYAQSSGTMQPHVEGSVALPLQIGFNSRAALAACDLTRAGIAGPRDVFEGPFGYLPLFEGRWDLAPIWPALGRIWRIAELSHKPCPAGRATHAGIEGVACEQMLANPARPLSPEQHLAKFRGCWNLAAAPLGPPEALIDRVEHIEELDDMRTLAALPAP